MEEDGGRNNNIEGKKVQEKRNGASKDLQQEEN